MARTLRDLGKDLKSRADQVNALGSRRAVAIAESIVTVLGTDTPVDTSEAISNWQVNIGLPVSSAIPPHMPGFAGSTYSYSRTATIAAAARALATKKPGQPIYISNLAPHIVELNNGSSKQAPAGFVQASVLQGHRKARKVTTK